MIHTRHIALSIFCLLVIHTTTCVSYDTEPIKIISYNVENLFDYQHDSLKNDSAFLPDGIYHWHYTRYQTKLNRIAQVIVNISGWESAPLVGLCEVENVHCLNDLCYKLKCFHYKFIHYEGPDIRGIDVALLYDSTKVQVLSSASLTVDLGESYTRDILYNKCLINRYDTLHVMMCHLPSQLGGNSATEWKRERVKSALQRQVDSILANHPSANIVIMGDMNTTPNNDIENMHNLMLDFEKQGIGTYKHQGIWSCIDQFYVSESVRNKTTVNIFSPAWLLEEDSKYLGNKPFRTYNGYQYHNGYSDHLPIILTIK